MKRGHPLDSVFYPRSVAVVGSKQADGHRWLNSVASFKGPKYHVNLDRGEWPSAEALGFPNYPSLGDIPGDVDYVLVSVPAAVVPRVLDDCAAKGVKTVHLYTAGFGETGTDEGLAMERLIANKARAAKLNLIGPNCLGVFNPEIGLRFSPAQYDGNPGHLGFISHSGTQAGGFVSEALEHGLRASKVVSMGNGIVLDSPDYMDYFAEDDDTHAVGMFLEGVRDGRRFFISLRNLCRRKPVLIWKVGVTEDAARAVSSHSGTRNAPPEIWDALLRQCGAIAVESLEDLINSAKAVLGCRALAGRRMGLVAVSGGHATEMATVFSKAGLRVPSLAQASYDRILKRFDIVGGSYRNPIEGRSLQHAENLLHLLDVLDGDENVDAIAHEVSVGRSLEGRFVQQFEDRMAAVADFSQKACKPYFAVLSASSPPDPQLVLAAQNRLMDAGVPWFTGFAGASRAIANAVRYYAFRNELSQAVEE